MPSADASPKPGSCFVIMPFGGAWDHYYAQIYEPAIREAGLVAVRAHDVFRAGSILQDIVDLLSRASVAQRPDQRRRHRVPDAGVEGRMRTLPTGIYALLSSEFYGNYPILAASLVLFSLPVLALYCFFQREFIEGLTAGALKH